MLKKGKVYVPKDEELRAEVIQLHHDVLAVGHGGRWKMVELVTRNYWWLGVTRDVGRDVEECDLCQRMKNRMKELVGKLKLSKVPEKLWMYLMMDFITKLPVVAGKDAILVVCDRLSKMTHFVATTEETSAEGLARLFRDNVWKLHGLLESVVSDRRPNPSSICHSSSLNVLTPAFISSTTFITFSSLSLASLILFNISSSGPSINCSIALTSSHSSFNII